MKAYDALRSMTVYTQNQVSLPRGERVGFGNCAFLLSPTRAQGYELLNGSYLNYTKGMYKNLLIDFKYNEKIGYRKYTQNSTGDFKKEFTSVQTPIPVRLVTNGNKGTIMKQGHNLLVNLGEWSDLFFKYQVRSSNEKICSGFFRFLNKRLNDPSFDLYNEGYTKILYIDIDQWLSESNKLSFERKNLTNPIAILLVTLYKFPDYISLIHGVDVVLTSPSQLKILKLESNDLTRKNYPHVKQKILNIVRRIAIDENGINEETTVDQEGVIQSSSSSPISNIQKKQKEESIRKEILGSLTKNLLGNPDDLTDGDDEDKDVHSDDDEINEVRNIANNYLDDHPELLNDEDIDFALNKVTDEVKRKYYIKEFTPKYDDKKLAEMQKLAAAQTSAIGNIEESVKDLASKIIDISDYSNVVKTTNPNILTSKFVNFDKSYNEKKLSQDIDNAVGMLSKASTKVYVIDKKEEDTSTQTDLKKTLTYKLKDENGNMMTLKFDIPVIIDDHYMIIKGNKKIIQHTLILKPLVKTGKDTVQINSNYQKMFIMLHGSVDLKTNSLLRYLMANKNDYDVVLGNGVITNKYYKSTMEYNGISRKIVRFRIDGNLFILDGAQIHNLINEKKLNASKVNFDTHIIIGVNKDGKPITMSVEESFVDKIFRYLDQDTIDSIMKIGRRSNGGRLLYYATTKPLQKEIPLVLMLMYFEGFTEVMKKSKIEYEIIRGKEEFPDVDLFEWGITELSDGYIKWKRYPAENSFLMNGLNPLPMHLYSIDDLDSKDTYVYLLTNYYSYANQAFNLDQYYEFMIDPITEEILMDMKLPTDLVELCLLANKMLNSEEFTPEGDLRNMRVRSNEILAYHTYKAITNAYRAYRRTQHKQKPDPISVRQDAVIRALNSQKASAMNDASSLNPVLEISKLRAITYKGESGTNEEHAFKLNVRAYNESMIGVLGATTSPDSGVGINRQMTLEPNIVSTRGYIDVAGKANVDNLNSTQLLAPSELLTPLGVQHDDPTRTSMAYKQTMYMVLPEESDSVLIGNGIEKVLPYHLSSESIITAEDDGIVIEETDEYMVVKFNNGRYRTIDKTTQIRKNAAAGFYIESKLSTDLHPGDKFTKNTVLAWDNKAFRKDKDSPEASMRLGPLVKIAIIPEWDIYEDSAPVSNNASEKLTTTMVMPVTFTLNKDAYISKIVKIGDNVTAGETLILFDNFHSDPDVMEMINAVRGTEEETYLVENYSTRKETHYTGTVADIEVTTTVPLEDLSESLQKLVKESWKKLKRRDKILDKYKNEDDLKYYKSGNVITNAPEPVKPDSQGKVRGRAMEDGGVIITFYISFRDILSRGDKISSEFALKSITSHVFEEGLEPYSEYRPDEIVDEIVSPLSISARKTPSIFIAMFGNKLLMEAKRHLKDYWFNN